jgi:dihydrofolate synthase/folylpolyglutamate synthase
MSTADALGRGRGRRAAIQLTYFEFTHLGHPALVGACQPDLVILEVGLGGRLDAVNVIDADWRSSPASTSIMSSTWGRTARPSAGRRPHLCARAARRSCADPVPPRSVVDMPAKSVPTCGFSVATSTIQRRSPAVVMGRARAPLVGQSGLSGAARRQPACSTHPACWRRSRRCATSCRSAAQAVRHGLATVELPGRFQVVPGQPALVLDVAHNPHAMAVLAATSMQHGLLPATWAVFGAMRDKDLAGIIGHLANASTLAACAPCRHRGRPDDELMAAAGRRRPECAAHRASPSPRLAKR